MAALAATFLLSVSSPYMQHWEAANQQTIARAHTAKDRAAQFRTFAQTRRELARMQRQHVTVASDAHRVVEGILADRKMFRLPAAAQRPAPQSWFERFMAWLSERWRALADALWGRVSLSASTSVALGDVFLGLAMVAFLLLVGRIILQFAGRSTSNTGMDSVDTSQDPSTLFARACREAEQQRYQAGITTIFAAALCLLDRRGLLQGLPSQTVGQLRRAVRRSGTLAPEPFETLCALLTQTIYADEPAGSEQWTQARSAYERLRHSGMNSDAA